MNRRLFVYLAMALAVIIPTGLGAAPADAATSHQASSKDQCKHDGWRTLTDGQGRAFRNQGQCVASAKHQHAVTLANLEGTFTGTQSFTFGTNGCTFVHQVFDATYPGSGTVGTVTLHIEGCVSPSITTHAGTFTISTVAGDVSGNESGSVNLSASPAFDLTLTVTAGTGEFAAETGTLHALINWPPPSGPDINGTVTVP